jgi:hypothetical protein
MQMINLNFSQGKTCSPDFLLTHCQFSIESSSEYYKGMPIKPVICFGFKFAQCHLNH